MRWDREDEFWSAHYFGLALWMEHEALPTEAELEKELADMRALRLREEERFGNMQCLVDVGVLIKTFGVTPRDAAYLAVLEAGDSAQWPVTVHDLDTRDQFRFQRADIGPMPAPVPPKKKPARAERERRKVA